MFRFFKKSKSYNRFIRLNNKKSYIKPIKTYNNKFDGDYKKVSRKFGISTTQVRNIVNYK